MVELRLFPHATASFAKVQPPRSNFVCSSSSFKMTVTKVASSGCHSLRQYFTVLKKCIYTLLPALSFVLLMHFTSLAPASMDIQKYIPTIVTSSPPRHCLV
jgi:hypothetical protein